MGWEQRERGGPYYTRSTKVNGRVVREYVGTGKSAALIAQMDVLQREKRTVKRAALKAARAELDALDARLNDLNDLAEMLAHAALAAAGYHQHKRGEWRKKRDQGDGKS